MKRLAITAAILGMAFAGWRWYEHHLAEEAACAILARFQKGSPEPRADEALALYELSRSPYAVRRAALANIGTFRCPSAAILFRHRIYLAATRLRASNMRRLAKDLGPAAFEQIEYEIDAEKALERLTNAEQPELDWQRRDWLAQLKVVADRLPERRAEIEREWILPRLFADPYLSRRPDFISNLSEETRRRHIPEIREALWRAARSSDAQSRDLAGKQALALADEIGDEYGGYITDALAAWPVSMGPYPAQEERDAKLLGMLVSRFRPGAGPLVRRHLARRPSHAPPGAALISWRSMYAFAVRQHGSNLEAFVGGLDENFLKDAKAELLPRWLAESDLLHVQSLAPAVTGCVSAMVASERLAALRHALRSCARVPKPQRSLDLEVLVARLLSGAAPAGPSLRHEVDQALAEAVSPYELDDVAEALAEEPLQGWSAEVGGQVLSRMVDQTIDAPEGPWRVRAVRSLCRALPEARRQDLVDEMVEAIQRLAGRGLAAGAAACLAELDPRPEGVRSAIEAVLDALHRLPENVEASEQRSGTLRALALLAKLATAPHRRELLQVALDASAAVVAPACADLAALAGDDRPAIARILRMPNCSAPDRYGILRGLAGRFGVSQDAFGRPHITASTRPDFDADAVRIALWLEEQGL